MQKVLSIEMALLKEGLACACPARASRGASFCSVPPSKENKNVRKEKKSGQEILTQYKQA